MAYLNKPKYVEIKLYDFDEITVLFVARTV
jgi:hypothetical protein